MERIGLRIGVAGWSIPAMAASLFPRDGSHLERYAAVFDAVEINSSFYRPHAPKTWRRWAASVPTTFRFSAKLPKTISHEARLRHCDSLLERFLAQVEQLDDRLGFLLLQLPPSLAFDERFALRFFDHVRRRYDGPFGCEPRHASWFVARVDRMLCERGIARVAADPFKVRSAVVPAGDRVVEYARLHGSPVIYRDAYPPAALDRIACRLRKPSATTRERWCIFDNTTFGHAVANGADLLRRIRRNDGVCRRP